MAAIGFVLVNAATGKEHKVQDALSQINQLSERYALHDEYDFLVVVGAEDSAALDRFVIKSIKSIPGVAKTKVVLAVSVVPVPAAAPQRLTSS